jgi:hypothetical protein
MTPRIFQRKNALALSSLTLLATAALIAIAAERGKSPATRPVESEQLAIKLPRPGYIGTPKDIKGDVEIPKMQGVSLPAPRGTILLSSGKPVTSSDKEPIIGQLAMITDGDKEACDGSWVELGSGVQWVEVDLRESAVIAGVHLWHNFSDARVYHDVVMQLSNDPDFIDGVTTIFNNDRDNSSGLGLGRDREYLETEYGKLVAVASVKARYVRCYANGSTQDAQSHYTEVEVYGVPTK